MGWAWGKPGSGASGRGWTLLAYVVAGRLLLLALICLASTVLLGQDALSFYAFIALAFVVNIPFALWARRETALRGGVQHQFLLDAVIITGLVHFTGGVTSQYCLLYPLVILTAGIAVSGSVAVKNGIFAALLYSTLVVMEARGLLVYRGLEPYPYADMAKVAQTLMTRLLVFAFFAAASSYLAERVAYHNRELEKLRRIIEFVFEHVSISLLAVEKNGNVLLANAAALRLFHLPAALPAGLRLRDLFVGDPPDLDAPVAPDQVMQMRRADGSAFPGCIEVSLARFPVAAPGEAGGGALIHSDRYVIAIRDMSQVLELQARANESARLQTAVGIATEVGHWIRNPLTVIKVAIEFVLSVIGRDNPTPRTLSGEDLTMIAGMCQSIADETGRLENTINDFLRNAEEDHERMRALLKDAETWSVRVKAFIGDGAHGQDSDR